jgi:DNA-binding transcriptional MerR regulator
MRVNNVTMDQVDGDRRAAGFRSPTVCKVVGITYRQLDYWARTGLIRPSLVEAAGNGTRRCYSYGDLVDLKVIKSLLDAGMSLQQCRSALDYLRAQVGDDLSSANLVIGGAGSILAHNGDDLVDILRSGQTVFSIVAMSGVWAQVDAAVTSLDERRSVDAVDPAALAERVG